MTGEKTVCERMCLRVCVRESVCEREHEKRDGEKRESRAFFLGPSMRLVWPVEDKSDLWRIDLWSRPCGSAQSMPVTGLMCRTPY